MSNEVLTVKPKANSNNKVTANHTRLARGRSCRLIRSSIGSPNRRKPNTNSEPMMSACNMLRVNTGHGVRSTQRTNRLIRPARVLVLTRTPYPAGRRSRSPNVAASRYCDR
jgi:hypothetical protein